eukprot:11158332-Lingulodinium_polyedra.AAC.1
MREPGIEPWAVHTLRCIDAPSTLGRLRAASGGKDPEAPTVLGGLTTGATPWLSFHGLTPCLPCLAP